MKKGTRDAAAVRAPGAAVVFVLACCLALAGCGGGDSESGDSGGDITAEVQAYYEAHPEFFVFAGPDDVPEDLEWEDGSGEEELGSPEAKKGGTFRYYTPDFPRTLRFVGPDASGAFRSYILDDNALGLTGRHPNTFKHFPAIAKEWAVGEDGKTVYFRIDAEARYSDGTPIRTDDFFFCFFFHRSPHIKAPWYNDYYKTKFERITKYDNLTISITYSEVKPDIIYRTSMRPVPQHFFGDFGEDYLERYNFRFEPTAGPYEVLPENIKKGRSVTLTRVKDWWAKDRKHYRYRYNPDKLRFVVVREPSKVMEVFRKGEIDALRLDVPERWHKQLPDDLPEVEAGWIEKITFYNEMPGPDWGLRLNSSKPPLDDRNVRLGLQHAMNWDLVIKEVFFSDFQRMHTVADGYGERSHPTIRGRAFDPKKAEEYFAKAGFTKRGPDGILVNEQGQRLSLTVTTGYKRFQDVLTVLKQEAKKAGVELNLEILEQTAGWKKADEKKHEINFSAVNRSVELYPRFWEMYHSYHAYDEDGKVKPNTNNDTMTAEPEIDEVIDRYRFSGDLDEITKLSHQLIEMLHEHGAFIPGWKMPFYRVAKWRWLKYPDHFDFRTSRDFYESHVFWIDEGVKEETLAAKKAGKTFPKTIVEYEQWKVE